jgi:hypothetical protein
MATSSHAMMLREISTAGDRERTGALDVAWDRAHASVFFKFGHPRHVTFEMADGRSLAGDDALTALVAELPTEIYVASWRRALVTEETLDLTADELIALFEADPTAISNGSAPSPEEPHTAEANDLERTADTVPAAANPPVFAIPDFPLLPLGAVLWSDAMANVLDLEAMVPLLPDCLLVLTCPEPQAAALVAGGTFADAVWMAGGHGLFGDDAARALMSSRTGSLTAYRVDDPRMLGVLRKLLREPTAPATVPAEIDAPSEPDVAAEPPAPTAEHEEAEVVPATAPTFDLAFAYIGMSGREDAPTVPALEPPPVVPGVEAGAEALTWSTRETPPSGSAVQPAPVDDHEVEPPAALPSLSQPTFGPVGRHRPALLVPVRVLFTVGIYALVWHHRTNRELEAFDRKLHAQPARSTLASFVAWLAALLIAFAGAVLFASTRLSIHLPFDRQLTSAQAYYLIGGLVILYLTLILPFRLAAVRTSLARLRSVEEHVGITSTRRLGRVAAAPLLTIPVIGGLVLLGVEQRKINAIWKTATIAQLGGGDVIVDRTPAIDPPAAAETVTDAGREPSGDLDATVMELQAEPATLGPDGAAQPEGPVHPQLVSVDGIEASMTQAATAQPVWFRDPARHAEEATEAATIADETTLAALSTDPAAAEPVSDEPGEPAAVASELPVEPVWLRLAAPQPEETTADSDPNADAPPDDDAEATTAAALQPEEAVEHASADPMEARGATEFVAPRLYIDVDALRQGLTDIAVKWLGADAAAPVAAAITTARPGVDDFVSTIRAIGTMQIPGHERSTLRAMTREMHYYATEVLCSA